MWLEGGEHGAEFQLGCRLDYCNKQIEKYKHLNTKYSLCLDHVKDQTDSSGLMELGI